MPSLDLLVSDVDRTLLTHEHVLPQRVVDGLARLGAADVRIVLASARSPEGLRPYARRLGLTDLAVCFNGGWIGDLESGATIARQPLDRADAVEVMKAARRIGLTALWFGADTIYAEERTEIAERETKITGEALRIADADDVVDAPGKIMCVRESADDSEGFAEMKRLFSDSLSVVQSHWRLLEIGPANVSKRIAIEQVAGHLGVARERCAAAGDAENDVGMLRWAGTAVTVANALDEIKSLAAFVGRSCDEGGMADVVDWLRERAELPA